LRAKSEISEAVSQSNMYLQSYYGKDFLEQISFEAGLKESGMVENKNNEMVSGK